ncbi:hypothetical protein EBZ80_27780, partial [bacterium]|nr:hypothetical protein [bacterium]
TAVQTNVASDMVNYPSNYNLYALDPAENLRLDTDGDGVPNLVDIDDDNDGVTDCQEGYSGPLNFTGASNNITNRFLGDSGYVKFNGTQIKSGKEYSTPVGDAWGNLGMATLPGIGNTTEYRLAFSQKIKLMIRNQIGPAFAGYLTGNEYEIFTVDGQGMTLSDPANELEIWSGSAWISVPANFTAKTIQWRLRGGTGSLAVGGGSFLFSASELTTFSWTQFNQDATSTPGNGVTLNFATACADEDTDGDGVPNRLDLDSDGDGCGDAFEAGSSTDKSPTFVLSGPYGANGLADAVETVAESGTVNYASTYGVLAVYGARASCIDTDGDGLPDFRDADADNDGVLNVTEAPSCFFTANEWNTGSKRDMVTV